MKSQLIKHNEDFTVIDNSQWQKESFLGGSIVLHTIQCLKISDHIVRRLNDSEFKLSDVQKNQEIFYSSKALPAASSTQEIHLDKLKITEGSILSLKSSTTDGKSYLINESEPAANATAETPEASLYEITSFKKIDHERLTYKNEKIRQKNSFFFRASDSENLFKVGNNFHLQYQAGVKYFGFHQLASQEAQQRTILGIASLIYYFEDIRILILTPDMSTNFFTQFRASGTAVEIPFSSAPGKSVSGYAHEGITYLEVGELSRRVAEAELTVESSLQAIYQDFDLVLIDLPGSEAQKKEFGTYFPILQSLENVTLILGFDRVSFSMITEARNYFTNYGIAVKGCVVDKSVGSRTAKGKTA